MFLRLSLALLLLFAAQFQVGLMPAQGASGQMVMVICSGDGPLMMVVDPQTGDLRKAPSDTRTAGCDWAGCLAIPVQQVEFPVLATRLTVISPVTASDLWRPAHDPRGIWARGPPGLV